MKQTLLLIRHFLLVAVIAALATAGPAVAVIACGSSMSSPLDAGAVERQTARGAVTVAADALLRADQACAAIVTLTKDKPLAAKCAAVYDVARTALVSAAIAVDTWDDAASRPQVACAVLDVAAGLGAIGKELRAKGGATTAIAAIDDAVSLSKLLGACTARKDGGS